MILKKQIMYISSQERPLYEGSGIIAGRRSTRASYPTNLCFTKTCLNNFTLKLLPLRFGAFKFQNPDSRGFQAFQQAFAAFGFLSFPDSVIH